MAWDAYYSFGGTEIINGPRFESYALNMGFLAFKPYRPFNTPELAELLGDAPYRTPFQDDVAPPWVDPDIPATYDFMGLYPLSITGMEDSTTTSQIVENTGDGGNPGRPRAATRQVVFSCLMAGLSDAAVEAGMSWLRIALKGNGCVGGDCCGSQLCYLSAQPIYDPDITDVSCLDDYLRYFYMGTTVTGPTVTAKNNLSDGSVVWQITWTVVFGNPFEYGAAEPIVVEFLNQNTIPNVAGGTYDDNGHIFTEVACPGPAYVPIFDPLCPDLVLPPPTPSVPLGCFTAPANWRRFDFAIPDSYIPGWTSVVPQINVVVGAVEVRNLRFRIFPTGINVDSEPCAYISDFLISYIPQNSTLNIDGVNQSVDVVTTGQSRRADSLVYDSAGFPLIWPELSCGTGYLVVVDALQVQTPNLPFINFALVPKAR